MTGRRAAGRGPSLAAAAAALALSLPAAALELSPAAAQRSGGVTNICFINGVNTTLADANAAARRIRGAYKGRLERMPGNQGQEFRFDVSYNRSEGLAEDTMEAFRQKLAELRMTSPRTSAESIFRRFVSSSSDAVLGIVDAAAGVLPGVAGVASGAADAASGAASGASGVAGAVASGVVGAVAGVAGAALGALRGDPAAVREALAAARGAAGAGSARAAAAAREAVAEVREAVAAAREAGAEALEAVELAGASAVELAGAVLLLSSELAHEVALGLAAALESSITFFAGAEVDNAHAERFGSDLAAGRRVFLVAHSQGNLFANSALAALGRYRGSIGMVGVASPASTVVDGSPYLTATDDVVVNAVRALLPSTLAGNVDNERAPDERDDLRHKFLPSYFNARLASRALIDEAVFDAMRKLRFPAPDASLAVMAAGKGVVSVLVGSRDVSNVSAGTSVPFNVPGWATATLTAFPAPGHEFAGWTLSPEGLACAGGTRASRCVLAAGSLGGGASASAAFERPPAPAPAPAPVPTPVLAALAVMAGGGGSVSVLAGSVAAGVPAGGSDSVDVPAGATATLTAEPSSGYQFAGWTLSVGLACAGGAETNPCALAAGSVATGASASAMFAMVPVPSGPAAPWKGPGSVSVSSDGATLTAVPYAPGAFERWEGAPCDGSTYPVCALSSPRDEAVAVFRPFGGGVKSLVFGFGYPGTAPDHFKVSFQSALGAGFSAVPGLERVAPGAAPARLSVPVHLHPWSRGSYLVEACDAAEADCVTASNGMRALEQSDSIAATGYFKAPVSGEGRPEYDSGDQFGRTLALSADGSTLAVGARYEGSSYTGTFAPGDAGYQAALDSDGADESGGAYVYRLSGAEWSIEAFIKAPVTGGFDYFGDTLALSADGSTLAVGARYEDSSATGVFAPGDEGYQAALDDDSVYIFVDPFGGRASEYDLNAGAVTVYRRSNAGRWALEAFVKAPNAGGGDAFGAALALSDDGSTLAVGAYGEDSASTGAFAPGDAGYQAALDDDSTYVHVYDGGTSEHDLNAGAVTAYRRSESNGRWALEAFIKAPKAGPRDSFGTTAALSADGATLAVGAPGEDSSATGAFAPGDAGWQAALESDGAYRSGAAYVYRRSTGDRWSIDAYVKAPKAEAYDYFARSLALSADGATLAVSAPGKRSGAAYVHRRSGAGRWSIEAFVKSPVAGTSNNVGAALALSGDGSALAVGAPGDESMSAGVFAPGDDGYQTALENRGAYGNGYESGAAYVYRRSDGSRWALKAFVKAPNPAIENWFGAGLALSADGSALAVGAVFESSGPQTRPLSGLQADPPGSFDIRFLEDYSGAVYLY